MSVTIPPEAGFSADFLNQLPFDNGEITNELAEFDVACLMHDVHDIFSTASMTLKDYMLDLETLEQGIIGVSARHRFPTVADICGDLRAHADPAAVVCHKCTSPDVRFTMRTDRSGDEGQTMYCICLKCGSNWTVRA